jgi:DNA-binding LytR/AlgR family response regulator
METLRTKNGRLRVFCIEDNPLIVLHLEMLIEELGHIAAGSIDSFAGLRSGIERPDFDVALVDIDLADGRTGGDAAAWLKARGCPSIFITGQEQLAKTYEEIAVGAIVKPVTSDLLASSLGALQAV